MNIHKIDIINTQNTELSTKNDNNYINASLSDSTRYSYQQDIKDFLRNGGQLPASIESIAHYLKSRAETLSPVTLKRRLLAIRQWHISQNLPDPTESLVIRKMMLGIFRLHGREKKRAYALKLDDLYAIIEHLSFDKPKNIRDKAIFLVGFFGAFRRSEIALLTFENIQFVKEGVRIKLPRSKTDQFNAGETVVIPFGNEKICPVRALLDLQKLYGVYEGPVFRRAKVNGKFQKIGLTSTQINLLIKKIAKASKLENAEKISSHSLRRGFATEASRRGASMASIQKHGRWESIRTVFSYIDEGREFKDSAVKVLFDFT